MWWYLQVVAVFAVFLPYCSYAGNAEDFRLLEDSFAQAYDEAALPLVPLLREERPEKRYNVPHHQVRKVVPRQQSFRKSFNPVYQPYKPVVIAPQYFLKPQYAPAPRIDNLLRHQSTLLPNRMTYLYSPRQHIVSFARRNPYFTKQPILLTTPRRNAVAISRNNPTYQQKFMYNRPMYYNYRRNPYANAQRRAYTYGRLQQQRLPYLARRPNVFRPAMMRSFTPRFYYRQPRPVYAVRSYQPRPYLYARDHSISGNHLNLNMGTTSHTSSHSILKAPGHTTTDTHVKNKQQTGGRVRGVAPAPKGKQVYKAPKAKYPFVSKGSRARGKVSASAKVDAKVSSSTASSSQSNSASSSKTNGGSRTTSSNGGWGGGAGAGYGTGQNAWGIGYGGGGGGSNWKIPNGMMGIPGMSGKFPGIPQGFPGMPSGGYGSKGRYTGAGKQTNAKRPSSNLKGKKVSLKPKKGLNEKAFKNAQNQRIAKPKVSASKLPQKFKSFANKPKSLLPLKQGAPSKVYRVQFFTSDPMKRPASQEWQNMRQRIISDVMRA